MPNGYLEAQVCAHSSFNGLFGILIARPCPKISVRNQDSGQRMKLLKFHMLMIKNSEYVSEHYRLATPFETSQLSIWKAFFPCSSEPSKTKPKPPFITSPLKCKSVSVKILGKATYFFQGNHDVFDSRTRLEISKLKEDLHYSHKWKSGRKLVKVHSLHILDGVF